MLPSFSISLIGAAEESNKHTFFVGVCYSVQQWQYCSTSSSRWCALLNSAHTDFFKAAIWWLTLHYFSMLLSTMVAEKAEGGNTAKRGWWYFIFQCFLLCGDWLAQVPGSVVVLRVKMHETRWKSFSFNFQHLHTILKQALSRLETCLKVIEVSQFQTVSLAS